MFRIFNNISKKIFTTPSINLTKTRFFSHYASMDTQALLQLANDFEKEGKVRTAEDIYKKIIIANPKCKEAYQHLMESWVKTRSLKVPQQELKEFVKNYESNFGTTHQDNGKTPSPAK